MHSTNSAKYLKIVLDSKLKSNLKYTILFIFTRGQLALKFIQLCTYINSILRSSGWDIGFRKRQYLLSGYHEICWWNKWLWMKAMRLSIIKAWKYRSNNFPKFLDTVDLNVFVDYAISELTFHLGKFISNNSAFMFSLMEAYNATKWFVAYQNNCTLNWSLHYRIFVIFFRLK